MPFIKNPKIVYTMDGKVFVLGGTDVEKKVVGNCYQIVDQTAKEIAKMNQPRTGFGCYVTNDNIFVAGGIYGSE